MVALFATAAPAQAAETRYSLAGGCFALQEGPTPVTGAGKLRLQATALGRYLLYLPDATFLSAQDDGSVAPAGTPSPSADWIVTDAGGGAFTLAPVSAPDRLMNYNGTSLRLGAAGAPGESFIFAPSTGCATYPAC